MCSAGTLRLGASQPPRANTLAAAAIILLICGLLFFAVAASVSIVFSRAAAVERQSDEGWQMVRGQIVGERVNQIFNAGALPQPGQAPITIQLVPQIEVQYTIGGEELKSWVEVPAPGQLDASQPGDYNLAQGALARYHRGDALEFYCDPADSSSLRMSFADGGRRTLLAGRVLAAIASVPAVGLVLAGWLLWRTGRNRRGQVVRP